MRVSRGIFIHHVEFLKPASSAADSEKKWPFSFLIGYSLATWLRMATDQYCSPELLVLNHGVVRRWRGLEFSELTQRKLTREHLERTSFGAANN